MLNKAEFPCVRAIPVIAWNEITAELIAYLRHIRNNANRYFI